MNIPLSFAIEGLDGSGKETTAKALQKLLKEKFPDKEVKIISFPDYTNETGKLIKSILSGSLNANSIIPKELFSKEMARLFTMNRREYFQTHKDEFDKDELDSDTIYIFDRYMPSNIIYQCQGYDIDKLNEEIINFSYLEYNVYGNPKPDFSVFLRVPYITLRERLDARKVAKSGSVDDIYEQDSFLKASYHLSELMLLRQDIIATSTIFDYIVDVYDREKNIMYTPEQIAQIILDGYSDHVNKFITETTNNTEEGTITNGSEQN